MPNDLTASAASASAVSAFGPSNTPPIRASATQSAAPPVESAKTPPATASPPAAQALHSNPVSWFDPATGLVVLQFYNAQGDEKGSIPSQKQLNSYRVHAEESGPATNPKAAPPPSSHQGGAQPHPQPVTKA